jgi:hypothetical protein
MVANLRSIAIAAAVIYGLSNSQNMSAAASCTGNTVTYEATGTFGPNIISGPDKFKLGNEPFNIEISVCESKTPTVTGADYAGYSPLVLKGSVTSGLSEQPTAIESRNTSLILIVPATGVDSIQLSGVVPLEGAEIQIHGTLGLALGTLSSTSIAPFPKAQTVSGKSDFTYVVTHAAWQASKVYELGNEILDPAGNVQEVTTTGTSGATAPVWNETLGGTTTDNTVVWTNEGPLLPTTLTVFGSAVANVGTGGTAKTSAVLHPNAVHVITTHADGTQSVRPMRTAPVEPAVASDRVMLQFYASGVRDASEVHMQIAGQDVPVLYAGASGHFPGLDEVTVEVPRTLAGIGEADAVLTVDGQTAGAVRVRLQ